MTFALILRRAIDWFYRRPFSRVISETVFRYGACGAITLSVDAVSYALIYHFWLQAVISTWDSWLCRRISPLWYWFSHYVLHRLLAEPLCRVPHAACCGGQTVGALSIDSRRIYFAQLRLYEIFGRGVRSVADSFQVYHIARRSSLQLPGGPLLYVQGNFFGKIEGICTRFIGLALRHLARSCRCSQFSGVCSPDFSGNTFVLFVNQV